MMNLDFTGKHPIKILCLGAHCDDIEIGCGGTILKLIAGERPVDCTWVTFCSNEVRAKEAHSCAEFFLNGAESKSIIVENFRDGFLPHVGYEVKDRFEELKKKIEPNVIFTHYGKDKHQDHRLISELTLNTFRNHLILEYEIPKYDGDFGSPNCFVPIAESICQIKVAALSRFYPSQATKNWFSDDLFWSLLRLRGMEINSDSKFSEGFYCNKMSLNLR